MTGTLVTNATVQNWPGSQVVTGPLTDTQLRANPVPVDTELPSAAALGDTMANPTAPLVGSATAVWDPTSLQWVRAKQSISPGVGNYATGAGLPAAGIAAFDGTSFRSLGMMTNFADNNLGNGVAGVGQLNYNASAGGNYDRNRNNFSLALLASAARPATPSIGNQTNFNHRALTLFLNVTATPNNAETLTVALALVDTTGATKIITAFPAILASSLGAAPAAGSREFVYTIALGAAESAAIANHEVQSLPAQRTFLPSVTHSGAGSWTYSLSMHLGV